MKWPGIIALTVFAQIVSGCAEFQLSPETPQDKYDQLMAEKEYGEAISWLESIPESRADYADIRRKLGQARAQASRYESDVLERVRKHLDNNDWPTALQTLDTALLKLPASRKLDRGRTELLKKRDAYILKIRARTAIARGEYLLNELPLRKALARIDPDDLTAQWELSRVEKEIRNVMDNLIEFTRKSMKVKKYSLASQCLGQIKRMGPDGMQAARMKTLEKQLARINRVIKKQQKRIERQTLRDRKKRVSKEILRMSARHRKRIQQLINRNKLVMAGEAMKKLEDIDPDNPVVRALKERLEEKISGSVLSKIEDGAVLYRQEKIEGAKKIWVEALKLDPDNEELKSLIRRAERVLENLQLLKENR